MMQVSMRRPSGISKLPSSKDPIPPKTTSKWVGALFSLGKYQEALEYLNQADKLNPNSNRIIIVQGLCYYKEQNFDQAIALFTDAINLNTKVHQGYRRRGYAYQGKGEWQAAVSDSNG